MVVMKKIILISLLLFGCQSDEEKLIGIWEHEDGNKIFFKKDGKVMGIEADGKAEIRGNWELDADILTISESKNLYLILKVISISPNSMQIKYIAENGVWDGSMTERKLVTFTRVK